MRWSLYLLVLTAYLIGIVLFFIGFFPAKVVLPGYGQFENNESPFLEDGQPQFEKIILVVIDALRSDFLFSENSSMHFVHKLVRENLALPYTAYADPPTVTLPRLKGITTGSTPNFLDVILNIADDKDTSQSMLHQDSWIKQFLNALKVINFFGDDTWLKLFPPENFFSKYDGTSSFFVNDFIQVDNNVTRHLDGELLQSSWDGIILHYLGLDHIGHKGGPSSKFMAEKQKEMDSIVSFLYKNYVNRNTLLVVMGDHGMNNIGNHGGSSNGETHPGLLFVSEKFKQLENNLSCPLPYNEDFIYYNKIKQIDLVPNLASLLNFPIPKNNLGVINRDILRLWNESNRKQVLLENGAQFLKILKMKYPLNKELEDFWKKLVSVESTEQIYESLSWYQDKLSSSATEYKYLEIYAGLFIILLSSVGATVLMFSPFSKQLETFKFNMIFLAFTVSYSFHFFASSLIEEEHQVWWFYNVIYIGCLALYLRFKYLKWFIIFSIGTRIMRSWSPSGQKYNLGTTISSYLVENIHLLWLSISVSYLLVLFLTLAPMCGKDKNANTKTNIMLSLNFTLTTLITVILSYNFKLFQAFIDGNKLPVLLEKYAYSVMRKFHYLTRNDVHDLSTLISKVFFYLFGVTLVSQSFLRRIFHEKAKMSQMCDTITIFLMHQCRVEIIPVFLIFYLLRYSVSQILCLEMLHLGLDRLMIIVNLFSICMQGLSFFSLGNTNLLATVDLSNSYNGLKSYNIYIVALLTFFSTFAGPIFWSLFPLQIFEKVISAIEKESHEKTYICLSVHKYSLLKQKIQANLFFYCVSALFLFSTCFSLRYHLFIWTVFSPKLLYFGSWSILLNIGIDSGLLVLLTSIYQEDIAK